MIKKLIPYLFWFYAAILIAVTVIPWSTEKEVGVGSFSLRLDYWLHLAAYFGLGFLFLILKNEILFLKKMKPVFYKSKWLFVFAFTTELLQIIVPKRNFSLFDFIANSTGILLSISVCFMLRNFLLKLINARQELIRVSKEHHIIKF